MGVVHTDFVRAFTTGSRFWDPEKDIIYTSEVLQVGELDVPSGAIVVSDPWTLAVGIEPMVLARRAPVGRWPAEVAVARGRTPEGAAYGIVAAMRLRFAATAAVRWEAALANEAGEPLGFGVDGGRISVFDRVLLDRALPETIGAAVDADGRQPASIVRLPVRERAELFVSDSGIGDGAYPAWWGLDSMDTVTELIVEFDVLFRSTFDELSVPAALLWEHGHVMTPELLIAGVGIEVVDPEEVPVPTWPGREPDPIGLALRAGKGVSGGRLLDDHELPMEVGPSTMGPFDDGSWMWFWTEDPRLRRARTLRLSVFRGNVPLGPPPGE